MFGRFEMNMAVDEARCEEQTLEIMLLGRRRRGCQADDGGRSPRRRRPSIRRAQLTVHYVHPVPPTTLDRNAAVSLRRRTPRRRNLGGMALGANVMRVNAKA